MKLEGKVAIVTGSAQGLGKAFAEAYSREGAKVVIADILDERARQTADEICAKGGEAIALTVDVTSENDIERMVKTTSEKFGGIDILLNNAALSAAEEHKAFYETTLAEYNRMMAIDAGGVFLCSKAVFPYMKKRGKGKIVNMASMTVYTGFPGNGMFHYIAAKNAVIGMTRQMAKELGSFNINVNCIAPGLTNSEGVLKAFPPEVLEIEAQSRSIKRQALPEDLTGTILFLSSSDSDWITGNTICVDGGSVFVH